MSINWILGEQVFEQPRVPRLDLSIVTTTYFSESTITEFLTRALDAAERAGYQQQHFEIIVVDDGSEDGTRDLLRLLVREYANLEVILLSRNFGHHAALLEGLSASGGELVFLIDSDLEEDPSWLSQMTVALEDDFDLIVATQASRKGERGERWTGAIAYRIMGVLTSVHIPKNVSTARLMRRSVVEGLLQFRDQPVILGGFQSIAGFRSREITVEKGSKGSTTYSWRKRLRLFLQILIGYSTVPLLIAALFGAVGVIAASASLGYFVVATILNGAAPSGFSAIFVSIWVLGGTTLFLLGTISVYLHQLLRLSRNRPRAIVNKRFRGNSVGK